MKIRDIEVDFDFLDANDMERFENEAKKVQEECKQKRDLKMSMSQAIKEECKIINNFFDNVFGKDISLQIFKGKDNLGDHIKAFEDIVREKMEKQKDLQNTFDRYKPNKEKRRYDKYKGRK